ncbi:leucine-rich repeat-containing protein 72-like [Asterias amurensis]|uniref:leucine-rich repeat-containing protein 72-like n=1 Tax=Asterias amurensis TaxID=7602 RepID=UPI003AB3B81E
MSIHKLAVFQDEKSIGNAVSADTLVKLEMEANGMRKNLDVTQLFLAHKNLETVCSFGSFKHLNELWLNGNRLRHVTCLKDNLRISHLFLQDNELVSISGTIGHLSCLQVLMLHNNQLSKLEETVNEMKKMQALHTLNLYHNPVAQEYDYRLFVIFNIPTLKLLDREEVHGCETSEAERHFKPDKKQAKDSVAFGRRSKSAVTDAVGSMNASKAKIHTTLAGDSITQRDIENSEQLSDIKGGRRRSAMQYSHFDWSKVPLAQERRTNKTFDASSKAQIVTVRFR